MSDPWAEFQQVAPAPKQDDHWAGFQLVSPAPASNDPWAEFKAVSDAPTSSAQPSASSGLSGAWQKLTGNKPVLDPDADVTDPFLRDAATDADTRAAVQSAGKTAANLVSPAASGVTLGFAPRLGAFADSDQMSRWFGAAPPGTPTYAQALKDRQDTLDQVRKAYPVASPVAEGLGAVAGMAMPGGAAANAARELGFAGRAAAGGATGAAMGAAQGAAESKDLSDWQQTGADALKGAEVGAGFGAGLPIAGATFGKAYQAAAPFFSSAPAGLTRTGAGLLANATGPETVGRLDALGPHGMVADTSPSALGLTQGIASKAGAGADTVVNALEGRAAGQSDRLLGSLDQNLGPAYSPRQVDAMMTDRQAATSPMYESAFRNAPLSVDISPVQRQLELEQLQAKGSVARDLDNFQRLIQSPYPVNGMTVPEYDARALHGAKEAMDVAIARTQGQTGSAASKATGAMARVRGALNDALQAQIPGYQAANLAFATAARGQEAFDAGRQALKPGPNVLWPHDLDHQFASLPLEQQALMRAGARSDIEAGLGTNRNDLASLSKVVGGQNDWNRDKMAVLFGPEQTSNIVRDVGNEQKFADSYAKVVGGSQSAQRLGNNAAIDAAEPQYILPKSGTMTGLLGHGSEYLIRKGFGALAKASGDSTREALARVLISGGPQAQANIQDLSQALLRQGQTAQSINAALSHRAALAAALTGYREATR